MRVCVFVLYIHGIFLEGYKETVNNGYLTSERGIGGEETYISLCTFFHYLIF